MEKFVIVEYLNNCRAITETFKSMHRIKLLDFDISNKYIAFGASSGGIFIFERFPCTMIKFIPSMEGSTSQIKISPEENHLAIANSKGLIVILENFFTDLIIRPYLQNDHEGNIVTTMNWHGDELYSGDSSGRVSAFTLAKAFFQNPSATLLQLDSIILQIDNYQNYFLVSTKKATYLCNSEEGTYKQIGEQLRNDDNGACFCKKTVCDSVISSTTTREIFKMVQSSNDFTSVDSNNETKIFCARPHGKLWEANFESSVTKTFNFKSISQEKTDTLLIDNSKETNTLVNKCDLNGPPICVQFCKINTVSDRFIITSNSHSVNIVDPFSSSLMLSKSGFKHIIGIKVVKELIFVWTADFKMHILSLQNLEDLIISTLFKKQFYLCSEICMHFKHYLMDYVKNTPRLSLLLILKDKLSEKKEVLNELNPIFSSLEHCYRNITKVEETDMIVDTKNVKMKTENAFLYDKLENKKDLSKEETHYNFNSNEIICIYRQYNLNKLQKNVELTEYKQLIQNLEIDDVLLLLESFMNCFETDNGIMKWSEVQLIKASSTKCCEIDHVQPKTLAFLKDAFININSSVNLNCKCGFPLPKAHKQTVQYYDVGIQLFNLLTDKNYYLDNIPYFYGHYLRECDNLKNYTALLVQFSDINLVKYVGKKLAYDTWEEIIALFIKLKEGICLNCSGTIEISYIWSWSQLSLVIIRFIGPVNTIQLLKRYATHIDSGELTSVFFNACIMAKAYENYYPNMDVVEQYVTHNNELNTAMKTYMEKKYLQRITGNRNKAEIDDFQRCSYCNLPLNGPVLSQYKKCICGSNIHYLCSVCNDEICNNCLKKNI